MADSEFHPDFKAFAALRNKHARGSLDPGRTVEKEAGEEADGAGKEVPSISQYQDPRDQLDQERHRRLAQARERAAAARHHAGASSPKKAARK